MKRVYTLYRVSTKKQVNISENHENDIPMQRGACKEFVKYKQDWEIVKEYEEKGVSGFKVSAKNRDAILDLQEAALNKEFDVLLVFMFDRIGRIDDETPFIVEWFVKTAGVEVWSVKEGEQRFETHVDKLTNYIRFWQASGESEKTSIRIKTRVQQLKLDGLYTGGALPYGYRIVPSGVKNRKGQELKKYEIDLEQYVVYRKIVEKTINNGTGSYVMAHFLNDQGYKTANGKKFTSKAILRILSAALPRGCTNEGETSEALQKLRIISDDEAVRIDEILKQRAEVDEEKRQLAIRTKGEAMLSGNIFCQHCGGRITTTHHKDHYFRKDGSEYLKDELKYRCYHKANKLCECDGQTNYIATKVDEAVSRIMRQVFEGMDGAPEEEKYKEILKKQQAAHNAGRRKTVFELEKDKRQLEVLQREIGKTLLGESFYSPEDLKEAINAVKSRIADNEERLEKLDSEMNQKKEMIEAILPAYRRFKSWAEEFDTADLEQKKMIACQLFDRIELGKDYNITIHMNITYQQFCSEWKSNIGSQATV
ncbi:MAG: recombinase family protein [Clostridium sp.]|nr:recombinase family protein [Clostridium sp.]MCM1224326.1 recombinase family protein [Lachnospiraceae bacterium]